MYLMKLNIRETKWELHICCFFLLLFEGIWILYQPSGKFPEGASRTRLIVLDIERKESTPIIPMRTVRVR
jgi:hypothetical protein